MPNWCSNALTLSHDSFDALADFCNAYNDDKTCEHHLPQPEDIGDEWFDWRVSKWGTKWDFGAEGKKATINPNKTVSVFFTTAWSPPIGLYKELVRRGFDVDATYFEGGMCFYGHFSNNNDTCNEFRGLDDIPDDIVETFGLADWIEDVKAEQSEQDGMDMQNGAES
jgi:hypothetical protein